MVILSRWTRRHFFVPATKVSLHSSYAGFSFFEIRTPVTKNETVKIEAGMVPIEAGSFPCW
jgi:hypothetical protein